MSLVISVVFSVGSNFIIFFACLIVAVKIIIFLRVVVNFIIWLMMCGVIRCCFFSLRLRSVSLNSSLFCVCKRLKSYCIIGIFSRFGGVR